MSHNPYAAQENPIERRLRIQWIQQERDDYKFPVPIHTSELPRSTSHSGWMRNDREAGEMELLMKKPMRKKNLHRASK